VASRNINLLKKTKKGGLQNDRLGACTSNPQLNIPGCCRSLNRSQTALKAAYTLVSFYFNPDLLQSRFPEQLP
jgi:hypothetical protein